MSPAHAQVPGIVATDVNDRSPGRPEDGAVGVVSGFDRAHGPHAGAAAVQGRDRDRLRRLDDEQSGVQRLRDGLVDAQDGARPRAVLALGLLLSRVPSVAAGVAAVGTAADQALGGALGRLLGDGNGQVKLL